jgi:sirohydrochlorin ferrochelatase
LGQNTSQPNVVVVPFFIADGLHSYQDIPVLLGIESAPGAAASQQVSVEIHIRRNGRALYYASAIGTEQLMADVILDTISRRTGNTCTTSRMIRDELEQLIRRVITLSGTRLQISNGYLLYHWADQQS